MKNVESFSKFVTTNLMTKIIAEIFYFLSLIFVVNFSFQVVNLDSYEQEKVFMVKCYKKCYWLIFSRILHTYNYRDNVNMLLEFINKTKHMPSINLY